MNFTERLTWQRKSRSSSLHTTTASNKKRASNRENLNVHKSPGIKGSWASYPTPKGRNLRVVIKLETIPEIVNPEIAQSSKPLPVKPVKNATGDMEYFIQLSDASSIEPRNANHSSRSSVISSIKSENIDILEMCDDSLRELSWMLPGFFPPDDEKIENSNQIRLNEPALTAAHKSVGQSIIDPPVSRDLPFREKPPPLTPPTVIFDCDTKTTNCQTASRTCLLCPSRVLLPQENSVQPHPSIGPQPPLPKGIENPTTELHHQQHLVVASERNTDEPSSWPLMPSRAPPLPPKSDKRQPVTITSSPPRPSRTPPVPPEYDKRQHVPVAKPPPRPPSPPWKPLDPEERPSNQIDNPSQRPSRHPGITSELEQRQSGSQGSRSPITRKVIHGYKKIIDDAIGLSRSTLRKDSGYSFTRSQISADHTPTSAKSIKVATRDPPLSSSQSNFPSSSSYCNSHGKGDILTLSPRNSETGTNSTAPSITAKACLSFSKATSKLKTKLSRFLSRKNSVQGNQNGSESSNLPAVEKYRLPELDFRSRTLLPFQCSMCFMQLKNKAEWIQHEKQHNNNNNDNEISDWYWRCGICDNILHSWDDRQNHIADEHFGVGQTLSSWNSSTSPYPWHKLSSKPISGFPDWDMNKLRSMQPTIRDDIFRKAEPRNACGVCDLAFPNPTELDEHMKQDHVSWSCPTTTKKRRAAFFFELCRNGCENQFHSCRCCYMSFCDDSVDWKQRKQHFEDDHHFFDCDHDQFFEHAQFCHHMASSHGVEIDSLSMTDLCRQKEYASS